MLSLFVIFAIIARPLSSLIGKIISYGARRNEEKVARKAAMERYMRMHALDIEH